MQALGVHAFAGGFTMGVQRVCSVIAHLEKHNFATETAERLTNVINGNWPKFSADMIYGNPRCTGFSCTTAGYNENAHGPWAKQCDDIHELCAYGLSIKAPIIMFESVQQAYSTGRLLLDYLRDELFFPKGYKIAHIFVSARQFNNSQLRRRYFFVAYNTRRFNAVLPRRRNDRCCGEDMSTVVGRAIKWKSTSYDRDCYFDLNADEWPIVPHLPQRQCLTRFAELNEDLLEQLSPVLGDKWLWRNSNMPFSMHAITRAGWDHSCPTLRASSYKLIHPRLHRPMTIGELCKVMGWGKVIPLGKEPIAQIAKGIVPAIGEWITKQAKASLEDRWDEDWEQRRNSPRQKPLNPREKEIRL